LIVGSLIARPLHPKQDHTSAVEKPSGKAKPKRQLQNQTEETTEKRAHVRAVPRASN
jgi:hypothetical protein